VLPRLKRHSVEARAAASAFFILVRRLPQAPLYGLLSRKAHCARPRLARIIPVTATKGEKTMATRTGSAVWEGTLKEGRGTMKLGSGAFDGPYSFSSRFEEGKGTNPEELIGAAEAGCFSMALSANLEKAGHPAKRISTTATVKLEMVGGGPKITTIDVKTEAEVPGIDEAKFREQAEHTKKTCPVSVVLAGAQINLDAKLVR
jgi:osmotically inducible protein OsmC